MSTTVPAIYEETILKHNRSPQGFGLPEGHTHRAEGFSRLCGETMTVAARQSHDGTVTNIGFEGEVSAVAMAAASLMSTHGSGKAKANLDTMAKQWADFLKNPDQAVGWIQDDPELASFSVLKAYRSRRAAAALPWITLMQALESSEHE